MGQSNSQINEINHPIINKTLNINNTDKCILVDKNGNLKVDNCRNASKFTFKNSEFINDQDNTCINKKLKTGICDLDSDTWIYDPSTGYVKNTDKCLVHSIDNTLDLNKDTLCTKFNYGPLNVFTEKNRNGKCGSDNIIQHKLNYALDTGVCDTNRVCNPLGICIDNNYKRLDYDSKYQYVYKQGKYDGIRTFTESDRNGKCGPLYQLPFTPGYILDSGKCDSNRYCSAFGECSNLQTSSTLNNAYDGPELSTINTNTKITPPESNYKVVYSKNYFGNKSIYNKF